MRRYRPGAYDVLMNRIVQFPLGVLPSPLGPQRPLPAPLQQQGPKMVACILRKLKIASLHGRRQNHGPEQRTEDCVSRPVINKDVPWPAHHPPNLLAKGGKRRSFRIPIPHSALPYWITLFLISLNGSGASAAARRGSTGSSSLPSPRGRRPCPADFTTCRACEPGDAATASAWSRGKKMPEKRKSAHEERVEVAEGVDAGTSAV